MLTDGSLAGTVNKVVVNSTVYVVTGLTTSGPFTFSVTAENDVSSQDSNINARTVNISIATGQLSMMQSLKCVFLTANTQMAAIDSSKAIATYPEHYRRSQHYYTHIIGNTGISLSYLAETLPYYHLHFPHFP